MVEETAQALTNREKGRSSGSHAERLQAKFEYCRNPNPLFLCIDFCIIPQFSRAHP